MMLFFNDSEWDLDEINDTGIIITSFDSTYELGYRAHLCDLNGNHMDFLTDDGQIKKNGMISFM